jgi:hypothetical protein
MEPGVGLEPTTLPYQRCLAESRVATQPLQRKRNRVGGVRQGGAASSRAVFPLCSLGSGAGAGSKSSLALEQKESAASSHPTVIATTRRDPGRGASWRDSRRRVARGHEAKSSSRFMPPLRLARFASLLGGLPWGDLSAPDQVRLACDGPACGAPRSDGGRRSTPREVGRRSPCARPLGWTSRRA